MKNIEIKTNEEGQRLDRFLRKYLKRAPLSFIYKIIRKDVKVNGKRSSEHRILKSGDVVSIYLPDDRIEALSRKREVFSAKKQFAVIYEDDNILVVNKPAGLLTHGDEKEKKNHLTNQVKNWLIQSGDYDPRQEKTFSPAPANRLDRNTGGIVIFGKNAETLRLLNRLIQSESDIEKYYLALVRGKLLEDKVYKGKIEKDSENNRVSVIGEDGMSVRAKSARTLVYPLTYGKGFSLIKVRLITGRTHQIRAHLAEAGHPIVGDPKYGDKRTNEKFDKAGVHSQLLFAYRIHFSENENLPVYLQGKTFDAPLPSHFKSVIEEIFGDQALKIEELL